MAEHETVSVVRELVEPCLVRLKIEVPASHVQKSITAALSQFRAHAKIPGFRPGKTPPDVVLRHHGKRVREEAQQTLIREATEQAVKQEKLQPETNPRLDNPDKLASLDEKQAFAFAVLFDIMPEIALPAYKGIPVTRHPVTVNDETVNSIIGERLQRRATHLKVDREAGAGDMLKVTYHGEMVEKDVVFPDYAKVLLDAQDVWFSMKQPEMVPGTITALTGAAAGAERRFQVTFPETFYEKELAGKHANYTFTVHEVHEVQVPPLTDELAKEFGATSAAEMKEQAKLYITAMQTRQQAEQVRQQVLAALMQVPDMPLPPNLVNRETYQEFSYLIDNEFRNGKKEEVVQQEQNTLIERARVQAKVNLKRHYVLRAIAQAEKINVQREDVAQAVASIARHQQITPKVAERRLVDSGRIQDVYEQVLEAKTLDHVISLAAITDAAPDKP